jgi:uncharacterized tellurite resistance protein B-like protein
MTTADEGDLERESVSAEADAVRRIAHELEMLDPRVASYLSGFALILARVANADLDICDEEIRRIESIVVECAGLPEAQAVLVVEIAKHRSRLCDAARTYDVTRRFRLNASRPQCRELIQCLYSVAGADGRVSDHEAAQIEQVAGELGFGRGELDSIQSGCERRHGYVRSLLLEESAPLPSPA